MLCGKLDSGIDICNNVQERAKAAKSAACECRSRENQAEQNLGRGRRAAGRGAENAEAAAQQVERKRKQEALAEKKNQETYKRLTQKACHSPLARRLQFGRFCLKKSDTWRPSPASSPPPFVRLLRVRDGRVYR